MTREELNKEESKGFAGLISLVSDVDTVLSPAAKEEPSEQPQQLQSNQRQTHQEPAELSKWYLAILVVIGFLLFVIIYNESNSLTTPAHESSSQTKTSDKETREKKTTELMPPKFIDYSSEIYNGPRAKVNLLTDFDKLYRTRIRNTQSQPVNFAGKYVLSTWGCGVDCTMGAAVNTRTGQVVELPGTACCWKGAGENVIFTKKSRLLVLAGLINETGQHGAHFYELKNNEFIHIKTIPVNSNQLRPPSPTMEPEAVAPTHSLPSPIQTPSNLVPPVQPQEQPRLNEEMPPAGYNLVLSTVQIRYCLAEDIRLESAKFVVNRNIDSDVDRFNTMVADYNRRCGNFRYSSGALERARREVELHRTKLQTEGISRFKHRLTSNTQLFEPSAVTRQSSDVSVVSGLKSILMDSLRLKPGATERMLDSGRAIVSLANYDYVNLKPDARIGYSDYRFLKKPVYIFGQEVIVIEEEYYKEWIGCCVNPGIAITVKVNGDTRLLQDFARTNNCGINSDGDGYYGPALPKATTDTYVTLSCKERDAP